MTRNTQGSRKLIVTLSVIIVLIASYIAVAYVKKLYPFDVRPTQQSISDSVKQSIDPVAPEKTEANAPQPTAGLPANPTTQTTEQVPTSPSATVVISSINQSNGQVSASATTSGNGSCVFLFASQDSRPVSRQVSISSKTCSSVIAETEFDKIGPWKLTVTYYSGGEKVSATQDVTIR